MRNIILFCAALLLAGCKANEVRISLNQDDIASAFNSSDVFVPFEATFRMLGDMDDEKRAQIAQIQAIVERHMEIDYFETRSANFGTDIVVEGSLRISANSSVNDAWYLDVSESQVMDGFLTVQLVNGDGFSQLRNEMRGVSFMLSPDAFHPVTFRLRGSSAEIVAPAVEVDGVTHLLWRGTVTGRVSLSFTGGPFENVGAGFLIR